MIRKMDSSETLVAGAIAHLGFTDVVYEPDGNVPPDFLINGRIAVEVRRLNQNYDDGVTTEGLETVAISLWRGVMELLLSLGPPINGSSWFVFYEFTRPVESWKTLKPKLTATLKSFMESDTHEERSFAVCEGFELEVFEASKMHETFYVLGGYMDAESGGWLLSELERNLKLCIKKSRKVAAIRSKYPEWWLALPDHIGLGLGNFDRQLFRDQISISHDWDRVLLIDPRDHTRIFSI